MNSLLLITITMLVGVGIWWLIIRYILIRDSRHLLVNWVSKYNKLIYEHIQKIYDDNEDELQPSLQRIQFYLEEQQVRDRRGDIPSIWKMYILFLTNSQLCECLQKMKNQFQLNLKRIQMLDKDELIHDVSKLYEHKT